MNRNDVIADSVAWTGIRDALMRERDALIVERNALMNERNDLMHRCRDLANRSLASFNVSPSLTVVLDIEGAHRGQLVALLERMSHTKPSGDAPPESRCGHHVVVVGGGTGEDGRFSFPAPTSWDHATGGGVGFHPVVLASLLPVDLSSRLIAAGFPGSGNGIVQGIAEFIAAYGRGSDPGRAPDVDVVGAFAADYRGRIEASLEGLAALLGPVSLQFAVGPDGSLQVAFFTENEQSLLFGLPNHGLFHEVVHKTHQHCGPTMRRRLDQGARCLLAVRHPLDVLVSLANKLGFMGLDMLADDALFRAVARAMVSYHASFAIGERSNQIVPIAYEDCQSDFDQVYRRVAAAMDSSAPQADIDAARAKLLNRSIAHGSHLWKPGVGKWRQYLDRRLWQMAAEEGLVALADRLGYDAKPPGFAAVRATVAVAKERQNAAAAFGILSYCTDEPTIVLQKLGLSDGVMEWSKGPLRWITSSVRAQDAFEAWLGDTDLFHILAAGSLPPGPIRGL